ncbi:Tudor/PWWP/MBT superfamily protein [Rhynchospora pubera]|uniref:Tudor/PWWP/MBT superfamily protein n=1 Tax=Rhynchospora pubera TaxID=906938 RepID=A0AAV8G089_9POAL|nr:Tudor/PWWP/MBT superfamily protein [Rhynchospora pubera]
MANFRAWRVKVLTDPILEGSCGRQFQSKTTGAISEVAPEGSGEKDLNFVDNNVINGDPTLIPLHDLTGGLNVDGSPIGHVLGEPVMKDSVEKVTGLVHSWRFREIDPVIVSDVRVEDGLIDSSSGGSNHVFGGKTTGVPREDLVLQKGSQTNTDSGKEGTRKNRMTLANDVDLQAHSRSGEYCAVDRELPVAEITPENYPFFFHQFGSEEKGRFVISDLVWGKVKSHPWWPGQIIDPSDASKLAIDCQKKGTLLVAYFWDKTFAWCDESQLKPFFSNFSAFEKQVSSEVFSGAVKSALKEVSRRIDAGTMCSCLNERSIFKVYPQMENAGVKQGFDYYAVNRRDIASSLNPRGLVGYIRELAVDPTKGTTDKLLYVMSKYHTKAFRRWMAFMSDKQTKLVTVPTASVNLPNNDIPHTDVPLPATLLMQINPSTPNTTPHGDSSNEKPKRKRGRPRKNPEGLDKALSAKRHNVGSPETPSKRGPSGHGNVQDSYCSEMSPRVQADGKRVVSAAKRPVIQLMRINPCTPSTTPHVESSNEKPKRSGGRPRKKMDKIDRPETPSERGPRSRGNVQDSYWSGVIVGLQADGKRVASAAKRPVIIPVVASKSDECNPTALLLSISNSCGKVPSDMEILRMFSRYGPLKGEMEKEVEGSQSQVKLVFKKRADAEMAFGSLRKQHIFGSSLLKYRLVDLPSEVADSSEQVEVLNEGDHGRVDAMHEEDHCLVDERTGMPSEINQTTLLLIFSNKSAKLPSEMELVRMFSHHGPLKERGVEKEVEGTTYQFKIAFKKHSSAQMAFTCLSKQHVFGPSLLSYKLVSLPVEACKKSGQEKVESPSKMEHFHMEVPALKENLVQLSRAPVDNITERLTGPTSNGQTDAVTDISVDPSSITHSESAREISDSPSTIVQCMNVNEQQAMALENSRSTKPKPISNGSTLLECTTSKSAVLSCNTMHPFQKSCPVWQSLQSLELFTRTPQQPHFKKLDRYCQEMREGMAVGLMVTYTNLVDSTKNLSFDDDVAVIEQKCTCLETLEENGFNVDLIRTRLNHLLQIKTDHAESGLKQAELEKDLAEKESESMSMLRKIEKISSDVGELEEQINALTEESRSLVVERDRLLELTVGNGHEISRLKNQLSNVNRSKVSAREEFARVLVEPYGGGSY